MTKTSGVSSAVAGQEDKVFSPISAFFTFFKEFMIKVEIFFANFGFVLLWLLTILLILGFVTFPFWFPALLKKYKSKSIGAFLTSAMVNLLDFFT